MRGIERELWKLSEAETWKSRTRLENEVPGDWAKNKCAASWIHKLDCLLQYVQPPTLA